MNRYKSILDSLHRLQSLTRTENSEWLLIRRSEAESVRACVRDRLMI